MTLVNQKAPTFKAKAVINGDSVVDFDLEDHVGKHYLVLFFYPKDFTFVCPTELHAFQEKLSEFEAHDTQLIACSTDSEFAHYAWLNMPKNQGGIQGVTYPIVADVNKSIASRYDILAGERWDSESQEWNFDNNQDHVAYRALFLIDKEGIVQHETINNMSLGRNVDEVLRIIDALQHVERYGEVCPANWHKGNDAMKPDFPSTAEYLTNH